MSPRMIITNCPRCGAGLVDAEIPAEHRHMYGGSTHFSRLVACYDRELDRTTHFECPDCGGAITPEEAFQQSKKAP